MRRLTRTLILLLPLICATAIANAWPQEASNPEQSEEGRSEYLGRRVARTMHWSGAEWLMRETREKEENASLVRRYLGVESGQAVCDLGCGNGFYTMPLAQMVGPEGKVFAVDIQQPMLDLLARNLKANDIENVVPILGTLSDPKLPAASCDQVLMVDVYHELSHPVTVLSHLREALNPEGQVLLLEFRLEDPKVPIKLVHKMSKAQMILEMSANGFRFKREFNGLPWQHLMAFEKDPNFPREQDQSKAEGSAVALGLARAWKAADFVSLSGYFEDRIILGPESPESPPIRVSKELWLKGVHEAQSPEFWRTEFGTWSTIVDEQASVAWSASLPGDLRLKLAKEDASYEFVLRRSAKGPWRVEYAAKR